MTYRKKLIEVALPLDVINQESAREKSIRHGHPSTLHLWWARRPFGSARALLLANVIDDPSSRPDKFPTQELQDAERLRLFKLLERVSSWNEGLKSEVLSEAQKEISDSIGKDLPTICDPFGGGGALPTEAARLGFPIVTGDLNPVAVTIQRAMLDLAQRFSAAPSVIEPNQLSATRYSAFDGLVADIQYFASLLKSRVMDRVGHLYGIDRGEPAPMAYIWARTIPSPDPAWNSQIPLTGSWVVSNIRGKQTTWVEPFLDRDNRQINYKVRSGGTPIQGTVERAVGTCLATGATVSNEDIRAHGQAGRMSAQVVCRVMDTPHGRQFQDPVVGDTSLGLTQTATTWIPDGPMSTHPQYMGCPRYGIDNWHKLFLPRQLAVIDAFISCLKEVEGLILESAVKSGMPMHLALHKGGNGAVAYSETIVTYLAFILDRCVSRWNTLSIWNSRGDKIEHIFRMQAFQMTWMFAEANPFSSASGGWDGQVEWVTKAIRELPSQSNSIIRQLDAEVQLADPTPTVLFTDPPYYDNVPYSDLADFFHIFLRKTIGHIWPNEFSTVVTPKREELVADHERHGDKETAKTHFETGIRRVLAQARSGADSRFPSLIYYAFRATESEESGTASTGWETFLQGLVDGGWSVIRTWPIRTELASGLKVLKNMLASSIVLVCRPRDLASPIATRGEFVSRLRSELPSELQLLLKQNIAPVDLAQSAIGPGIAIFSSYSRIVDKSGDNMSVRSALILINEILAEILSGEDSDLDPETRFAITWYEQFGNSSGVFGQADVLAKAKNTTVDKVRTAGLVLIQDGKVRLCQITDLNTDWSPLEDSHLTVWEITHYLILRLEKSEMAAANLLRLVGSGLGDSARQLSYRLFQLSEKRSDAESAGKYNMLVTAWPQIQRLAAQGEQAATEKSLF